MAREITTGAYWFYRDLPFGGRVKAKAVLVDSIDADVLMTAAQKTANRYPFLRYATVRSGDNTRYLLIESGRPFSIINADDYVTIDGTTPGACLWGLSYCENRLYLSIFHGLVDGMGIVSVMKAILSFYFSALTGAPLPTELARHLESPPQECEYADPFDYARQCKDRFAFHIPEAFMTEPESFDTYVPHNRLLTVPLKELLHISKQTEGSVSGVLALIMARAIDRQIGDPEQNIVVQCPINLRPLLGCTETFQNCVASIRYVYSPRLRKMPLHQQASCFKGMLMIQSSEEHLMNQFYDWKKEVLSFNKDTSLAEKQAILRTSWEVRRFPVLSYLGNVTIGEYDRYLHSMNIMMDMAGGTSIVAFSFKGWLYLSLHMSEKNKCYLSPMTDEFAALGLSCMVE